MNVMMKFPFKQTMKLFSVLAFALVLAACGGGGDSAGAESEHATSARGMAAKGPLDTATILTAPVGTDGRPAAVPGASGVSTDADGSFTLPTDSNPRLVSTEGGSYRDESDANPDDGIRQISLGTGQGFENYVAANQDSIPVTPITQLLVTKARRETSPTNFAAVIENNRAIAIDAFGFDPLVTIPANPITPAAGTTEAEKQYAMLLGGFAQIANRVAIELGLSEQTYEILVAVAFDLSDGRLDGLISGVDILFDPDGSGPLGSVQMPTDIDLNTEIERFRNNNATAYTGTPLLVVDEDALSASGSLPPAPVAADDSASANSNADVVIPVLDNDTPGSGANLVPGTLAITFGPNQGSATIINGEISYTPVNGLGDYVDEISYTVDDDFGQTSNEAFVLISVTDTGGANQPPQIITNLPLDAPFEAQVTLTTNEIEVTDPDNSPNSELIYTLESPGPQKGILQRDGFIDINVGGSFTQSQLAANRITYSAGDGFSNEQDTFVLDISDGADSITMTVTVNIGSAGNNPPVAVADSYDIQEGTGLTIFAAGGVLSNDSDPDGDPIEATQDGIVPNFPPAQASNFVFNSDGGFTYLHDGTDPGSGFVATFSYQAREISGAMALSNEVQVSLNIIPVNDDPFLDTNEGLDLTQGGRTTISGSSSGVLIAFDEETGDPAQLNYDLQTLPEHGLLFVSGVPVNATGVAFSQLDIDVGNVRYEHDGTANLSDSFDVVITDPDNGSSSSETVSISVSPFATNRDMHFVKMDLGMNRSFDPSDTGAFTASNSVGKVLLQDSTPPVAGQAEIEVTTSTNLGATELQFTGADYDLFFDNSPMGTPGVESYAIDNRSILRRLRNYIEDDNTGEISNPQTSRIVPLDIGAGMFAVSGTKEGLQRFELFDSNNSGAPNAIDPVTPLFADAFNGLILTADVHDTAVSGATTADLAGDWGVLQFEYEPFNTANDGTTFLATRLIEIAVDNTGGITAPGVFNNELQRIPGSQAASLQVTSGDEGPIAAADGVGIVVTNPDGQIDLEGALGFVDNQQEFFATSGVENPGANQFIHQLTVAVRRPVQAVDLDGRSYRLQSLEASYGDNATTEIIPLEAISRIDFSGTPASLTAQLHFQDEVIGRENDLGDINVTVNPLETETLTGSIDAQGKLTLSLDDGAGGVVNLEGFVSAEGRMLILRLDYDETPVSSLVNASRGLVIGTFDADLVTGNPGGTGFDLDNTRPEITEIQTGDPTQPIPSDGTVNLDAIGSDPDVGDPENYSWFATAGNFVDTNDASAEWQAPSDGFGFVKITAQLDDGEFAVVSDVVLAYGNFPDTDGDGLVDFFENQFGTDVNEADTDGDGLNDFEEVNRDNDPTTLDIVDGGDTDPFAPDTDFDGVSDFIEIQANSNPHVTNQVRYYSNNGSDSNDGLSWATAKATPGTATFPSFIPTGTSADDATFILIESGVYESGLDLNATDCVGGNCQHIVIVGSVADGVHVPQSPPNTRIQAEQTELVRNTIINGVTNLSIAAISLEGFNEGSLTRIPVLRLSGNSSVDMIEAGIGGGFSDSASGAGFLVDQGSSLNLDRALVNSNRMENFTAPALGAGGAVFGSITVENSVFTDNFADASDAAGGGLYLDVDDVSSISNSFFAANLSQGDTSGLGGAIFVTGTGSVNIFNNLISANRSAGVVFGPPAYGGGGILVLDAPDVTVQHNTIIFNEVTFGSDATNEGGGLALISNSNAVVNSVTDNILWFNDDTSGTGQPDNFTTNLNTGTSPNLTLGFNNIAEGHAEAANRTGDPRLIEGVYLEQDGTAPDSDSLNAASNAATFNLPFTTEITGAEDINDPANGEDVDQGFHQQQPSPGPVLDVFVSNVTTPDPQQPFIKRIIIQPYANTLGSLPGPGDVAIPSGRLIGFCIGNNTDVAISSTFADAVVQNDPLRTSTDPDCLSEGRLAIDKGTGEYLLEVGGNGSGNMELHIYPGIPERINGGTPPARITKTVFVDFNSSF